MGDMNALIGALSLELAVGTEQSPSASSERFGRQANHILPGSSKVLTPEAIPVGAVLLFGIVKGRTRVASLVPRSKSTKPSPMPSLFRAALEVLLSRAGIGAGGGGGSSCSTQPITELDFELKDPNSRNPQPHSPQFAPLTGPSFRWREATENFPVVTSTSMTEVLSQHPNLSGMVALSSVSMANLEPSSLILTCPCGSNLRPKSAICSTVPSLETEPKWREECKVWRKSK
mmetsp:Transcript_10614/g.20127  ORF Transcript_10614/g.20127 Transcript_10614/m.20127 type:complete len:231 (+) Transcript_10614:233-925(+)